MQKQINKLLNYFSQGLIIASLLMTAIDVVKYSGFIKAHFYIDPLILFGIGILIYFLISSVKNKLGNLLLRQSQLFRLPLLVVYLIFVYLENFRYPNFVFSKYHLNIIPIFNLVIMEFLIFYALKLRVLLDKSLDMVSTDLKLSRFVVSVGLVALVLISWVIYYY